VPTWGLAVAAGVDQLYAAGGFVWDGSYLNATDNLWLYDPVMDRWSVGAAMPAPRTYVSAAFLNGLMYVLGPAVDWIGSAEVYHP